MTFWTVTVLYFQLWHTRLLKYFRLTTWFNKRSPTETHYGRAGKRPRGTSGQGLPVWRLPVANAKRPDKYKLKVYFMQARNRVIFPWWGASDTCNCVCGGGGVTTYLNRFTINCSQENSIDDKDKYLNLFEKMWFS